MRWEGRRESENIEDRRGMRITGGGLGIGGIALALLAMYLGVDPSVFLQGQADPVSSPAEPYDESQAEAQLRQLVSVVLADTEDTWRELLPAAGRRYQEPKLVLFSESVESGCGTAGAAVGPFYCPVDRKIYLDLSFYAQLAERFGAPGDFAQAYVVAHEVGHHVQNLLGIWDRVRGAQESALRRGGGDREVNALSVRLELQADCYAGIWAHSAARSRRLLESGDAEEALAAASAIGDDKLQEQAQGRVVPESFTHGSSAQRVRWFQRGLDSGSLQECDTFSADRL